MKSMVTGLVALALGLGMAGIPRADASASHNGACSAFAGSTGGYKYAGIKCYLDSAPGDFVIRHSIWERDNAEEYRKLLRLPKRLIRCTLTKGQATSEGQTYNLSNC